jgi:hypothetical protein
MNEDSGGPQPQAMPMSPMRPPLRPHLGKTATCSVAVEHQMSASHSDVKPIEVSTHGDGGEYYEEYLQHGKSTCELLDVNQLGEITAELEKAPEQVSDVLRQLRLTAVGHDVFEDIHASLKEMRRMVSPQGSIAVGTVHATMPGLADAHVQSNELNLKLGRIEDMLRMEESRHPTKSNLKQLQELRGGIQRIERMLEQTIPGPDGLPSEETIV